LPRAPLLSGFAPQYHAVLVSVWSGRGSTRDLSTDFAGIAPPAVACGPAFPEPSPVSSQLTWTSISLAVCPAVMSLYETFNHGEVAISMRL
jgi:hypothetical protein